MLSGERERQGAIRELLQRIVEQFVAREGRGQTELRQFERLAGDLIDVADSEIVATLAEALCRHPDTPTALIRRFCSSMPPTSANVRTGTLDHRGWLLWRLPELPAAA